MVSQLGGLNSVYRVFRLVCCVAPLVLTACFGGGQLTTATAKSSIIPGVDGAPVHDVDISNLPDAVPKQEPITRAGNKNPYTVFGKTYHLLPVGSGYRAEGMASWYGTKFHGRKTANGEIYDMYAMTAAHKTLPIPSYVRVTHLGNNRSVVVRVNDRGPFHGDRIIDLSYAAAKKLGYQQLGTAQVRVELIDPTDYQPSLQPVVVSVQGQTDPEDVTLKSPNTPLFDSLALNTPISGVDEAVKSAHAEPETYQLPDNTFLQVGAFSTLHAAESLQSRIAPVVDQSPTIRSASGNGGKLFRVLVGPFQNAAHLRYIREALDQREGLSAFIIYDTLLP